MNAQEREQLSQFLQQLALAKGGPKDPEAHALIESTVACQPDAAYLLVQRSLLQDQALRAANVQIANLQAELQRLRASTPASSNFLDSTAWGRAPVVPAFAQSPVAAPAPVAVPSYQAAPVAAAPSRFQAPSFLTSMATTAAGVAAGAFLFQGIESLVGHHGGGSGASAFGLSDPGASSFSGRENGFLGSSNSLASDSGVLDLNNPDSLGGSGNDEVFDLGDMGGDSNDWA